MSQKWMIALMAALAVGSFSADVASAQTPSTSAEHELLPPVDFDQVFGDVEVVLSVEPEATAAFRQKLYRAGLKMINAIPYDEWALALEAARAEGPVQPAN
jgi:hypothetical protein